MKNRIQFSFYLCIVMIGLGASTALKAQDVDKEMAAFAQQFQAAYNLEDHMTLKTFYTQDAKRVAKDGSAIQGVDAIGAFWEAQFKGADAKLALSQQVVVWKDNVHAYVVSGAYHVVGTTAKGDPVDVSGKYSNIMLKVDGAWKISESALTD